MFSSIIDPLQPYFVMNADSYYKMMFPGSSIAHFYRFTCKERIRLQNGAVPDGTIDILFDCDPNVPSAFVAGTVEKAETNVFLQNHTYFGVRSLPGILDHFGDVNGVKHLDFIGSVGPALLGLNNPFVVEKVKKYLDAFPMEEGYRQVVELLKKAAPIAKRHNILVVIEPLRKAECNLINSFKEGCRLAADADEENVKVLVDYYHLCVEQEPEENVEELGGKYLRHVHFSNPDGRVYPKAGDKSDYLRFFEALKKAGYDGRVSCEAYSPDYAEDAKASLAVFRSLEAQIK